MTKKTKATHKARAVTAKVTGKTATPKAANPKAANGDKTIKLLVTENPKRGKSRDRFALYQNGQTVEQYVARSVRAGNTASLARADLRWDVGKGLIAVQ